MGGVLLTVGEIKEKKEKGKEGEGEKRESVEEMALISVQYRKGFPSNWAGLGYWASRTARHLCGLNRPHCSCALRGETTARR